MTFSTVAKIVLILAAATAALAAAAEAPTTVKPSVSQRAEALVKPFLCQNCEPFLRGLLKRVDVSKVSFSPFYLAVLDQCGTLPAGIDFCMLAQEKFSFIEPLYENLRTHPERTAVDSCWHYCFVPDYSG